LPSPGGRSRKEFLSAPCQRVFRVTE
jgi:hypothetical protein